MSFSDQNLSIVQRRCRKLFTFSSSFQEPLGQVQPNLAQCILGWMGFKFVQMKGPALLQGDNYQIAKNTMTKFKKIFFSWTTGPISAKLGTKHPWVTGWAWPPGNSPSVSDHELTNNLGVVISTTLRYRYSTNGMCVQRGIRDDPAGSELHHSQSKVSGDGIYLIIMFQFMYHFPFRCRIPIKLD